MKDALRISGTIVAAILASWLILLAIALLGRALIGVADSLWTDERPQRSVLVTRADYQTCAIVHNGPLQQRIHRPYARRSDTA